MLNCAIAAIVAFVAGFCASQIMHINDSRTISKYQLITVTQDAALEAAEEVMWNNDLPDTDGSDDMELYLELCHEADSLRNAM